MILKGAPVAEKIYESLKIRGAPRLAVILVGDDPASVVYVKIKEKIATQLGIGFDLFHLPGISSQKEVEKIIAGLNQNDKIAGIIVQLPLPEGFDAECVLKLLSPAKDVDGFYGRFPAPTAQAIWEILRFYGIFLEDKKIVIVGRGRLVGAPLGKLLHKMGFKPAVYDSHTTDLARKLKNADIIVTATGVPGLINLAMVSARTIIIDAGTSEAGGKLVGDVDLAVYQKVQSYTPVPGGVGPVTVACLMRNVVAAAKS